MGKTAYTAVHLSQLLAARHAKDVFVPECKMGAAGSRQLDGWVLLPTWSPMTAVGYEIKVSRSDWLQDGKFEEYRQVCHLMFVVAPRGIVQPGELPPGVGLLEPIGEGTGARLVMRSKAVRGEPNKSKLVRLMAHVLMWRRDQREAWTQTREQRAAVWRSWVAEQQDFEIIGRRVRGRMRTILKDALDAKRKAEANAEQLAGAAEALRELGVTPGWTSWDTKRRIERAIQKGATEVISDLGATIDKLAALKSRLEHASGDSAQGEDSAVEAG